MRTNNFKATLKAAVRVAGMLPFAAVVAFGQQQVNLTAGPATATLPDGSTVPMWGYSCGAVVAGSTASCAKLNPAAAGWSPVLIKLPAGQDLRINLTNHLSFGTTPNNVPTSLVIVGQLGGGLGTSATSAASPSHANAQQVTWPIAVPGPAGTPPAQGPRVRSFSTEVAATPATSAASTALTWIAPRQGTYLIESGTHPSIQGPMGLYGMLVVTGPSTAYTGVNYDADVPLLLSEIDPVQNKAVSTAVNTVGFSEAMVWSGQPGGCGNPTSATFNRCYPPAVNYTPLYYLFNGAAFDKTNASASMFQTSPATGIPPAGNVLVRLVNAGLRMHVPSIVGSQTGTSGVGGFSLIAEDGNLLPGVPRVQSEIFMAAGKTYDVMMNVPAAGLSALPVFDRELSLSGNAIQRDAGMLAYISVNGAGLPASPAIASAAANPDTYASILPCSAAPCKTLTVSDPSKGVIANDVNVYGVKLLTAPTKGTLTLAANGTFTYVPNAGWTSPDSFVYQANGSGPTAAVTLSSAPIEAFGGIVLSNVTYVSNLARSLSIKPPGVLSVDKDQAGYPLTVATSTVVVGAGLTLSMDPTGGFNAIVTAPGTYTFSYKAQNSQGTLSASAATVTLIFPPPSNLVVSVLDGKTKAAVTDYRWIIEEDRTFYIDPTKTTSNPSTIVPTFGVNFHTSYMPVVAQGCVGTLACESGQKVFNPATGTHVNAVCDVGNGVCRTNATQQLAVNPSQVHLDPTKRYYISILPGDGANPFNTGNASSGHGMGGAPIAAGQTAVTVLVEPTPFRTAKLSVYVFQDDFPLNGEVDAGGEPNPVAPNEAGLGGFHITLFDDAGGTGDATGQMTYDMFNMPLSNSLAGFIDPSTGLDACPISKQATTDPTQKGMVGMIITCPKYEADGITGSPLAGQAVIANMMPGRYGVVASPGADRIARGEEWLQTNTLDGQKAHDSFLRVSEPSYFQEFGPPGYHVSIGFANPKIINDRKPEVCAATTCDNSVTGTVTAIRMSRTPDERLYSSGSRDAYAFTQCYVSLGDADGEDFAFTKCDANGKFTLSGLPSGTWRITIFDQWNDQLVDGLSTPVALTGGQSLDMGDIPVQQWQANLYTRTFFDRNGDGVSDNDHEPGLSLVATNIRFRDGSFSNFNNTDLNGFAGFNEVFPLFNWYVVETDSTRYKNTGTHVVYDAGGPADGTTACGQSGYPPCGSSTNFQFMANTSEQIPLPTNLRVPGAVYCDKADCGGFSIATPPLNGGPGGSTGRIDPPWVTSYGWQGFSAQNSFLEFGKTPFAAGENGGIKGHVVYASTRPFDDPQLLLQTSWEPLVPHVTINLYQEGTAPDGSQSLTLVDTTQTTSWDDWAQGFRSDGVPNMNCPGQSTSDLFYFSLFNQPNYLNPGTPLPNNSQFKCYDGMHNWNQLQPAPYDGMYQFPSIIGRNPTSGVPTGTGSTNGTLGSRPGSNCTICVANPTDGTPMLPPGKYVVEVVVPPGYELVKEEDKNILIGDNYIAPVTQQFGGLGSIFILPDQAAIGATYNARNAQNPTQDLGSTHLPRGEGDTGSVETFWPCVGQARIVPDYISLFPQSLEVSPFAGATRNLCDRKEVTLEDQAAALAKFYIFTSTHVAAHFTGIITDDFTSEFDPFSPVFGEKFAPPNMPISIKDWAGNEISRVYSDRWGVYNGLNYSTWEVNPPNPTGYAPTMMVTCMNDSGPIPGPNGTMITDPLFNPAYSQFCYEIPFMPGQTQYMDTPVIPTSAFSEGYNHPDCAYPNATPAIKQVDGDGVGPWVSAAGHNVTITALGDQIVPNNAYSGPSATTAPYNKKTITRHYGFGTTRGTVTIGGVSAIITSWTDSQIVVLAPNAPLCPIQQQAQYGGFTARCGELVVTAANGQQSIDTVTVTIGGKLPTRLAAGQKIQSAIDAASPGDLIIVPPGTYNEILLMWKPVRLQGVGAASSIINANTHPAGKMDPWRRQVDCLFGVALNGAAISTTNPYDPSGTFTCSSTMRFQVDRIPLEPVVGWDSNLNGNLAELLQEPTLMGAYEGAAITVLAKGAKFPPGSNVFGTGPGVAIPGAFPDGTTLLTASNCTTSNSNQTNPFPSNFWCNPSRIDGLSITDSSQGGGGIFVHGWGHNLEISNNRVYNNNGTMSGGIGVGQPENPGQYLQGAPAILTPVPGSCQTSSIANTQLPFCFDMNVNVHNNAVTSNSTLGDELFAATPSGAGGVTFCNGSDYYHLNRNWICGNMSTGDGGGVAHFGFNYNGDISNNWILFNQSVNPTVTANGGGIVVMGDPDADPVCPGSAGDGDCPVGISDGTGPGLVINANLIMGNAAESGSGGGLRFQGVNGTELSTFPTQPSNWYSINVTNNIIANNVAGWDGAGVSLQDSLVVNLINNTIVSNDTTASAGVLFNTFGAPLASSPGPTCTVNCGTASAPQAAGLVAMRNSVPLLVSLPTGITCPTNHPNCAQVSFPYLANDVIWQNRAFYIGVGALSPQYQQNIVSLYNAFSGTPAASQPQAGATQANGNGAIITGGTGACTPSVTRYWDIGVRGDTGPSNHGSGFTLAPTYSVLTDAADYPGLHNTGSNPTFLRQYCNGSRTPPEFGSMGYQVPPGIADATVPNPVFNLTPAATVDEGNNWVNMSWGPLSLTNSVTDGGPLGNYRLAAGSPAINYIPTTASTFAIAPRNDFFGNPRPISSSIDVGAIEFQVPAAPTVTSIAPAQGARGANVAVTFTGNNLTGATTVNGAGADITVSNVTVVSPTTVTATFSIAGTALLTARSVSITTPGGISNTITFTVVSLPAPTLTSIAPNTGVIGTSVPVTLTGTNLTGASAVNVSGADVVASSITVVNSTTVTASLAIAATAALGGRNVTVTTPSGTTTAIVTFTVAAPTLTSIAPATGAIGTSVPVTLTGTNLNGASAVNVSGGDITVSTFAYVNSTTVTATLAIPANAALGARTVSVTTPIGNTNTVNFTVNSPTAPTLTSIGPVTGVTGHSVPVTLTGTNLSSATALNESGGDITISGVTVVSATSITATFTIPAAAAATARNVTVTTLGGTTNPVAFTVIAAPTLTSIAPSTGLTGTNVPVTLTGANLTGTSAVTVSGTGVTVSAITVVNPTTVTATFAVAANAAVTARNVTVTTPAGASNAVTFTPVAPPTLTSIAPNTGVLGVSVPVTLTGTSLTGATSVNVSGADITVGAITVVNPTTLTTTFTIPAGATLGGRTVSVTTPIATSNTVAFTVVAPSLTSIAPAAGLIGANVPVTLTGTNLTGASAVNVSTADITVSGFTFVNSTTVTATFAISGSATLGGRTVSVTTPSGNTNTVTFTVVTAPTLTSIAPTSGAVGNSVPVTLIGTNLAGVTAVTVSGTGVTVSGITASPTTVTATLAIAASAALTARNVTVTGPGGVSNPVTFTVVAAPTLTSIAPSTGLPGATVSVTLTGTSLTGATAVNVSGTGVTVSGFTPVSATSVTATFAIASGATAGTRTVSVATPIGTTNTVNFSVGTPPTLTSINPTVVSHPTSGSFNVQMTLVGTNFTGATGLTGLTGGLTIAGSNFTVVNSTTITAIINIPSTVTTGVRNIGVATPNGNTNTKTLTVN